MNRGVITVGIAILWANSRRWRNRHRGLSVQVGILVPLRSKLWAVPQEQAHWSCHFPHSISVGDGQGLLWLKGQRAGRFLGVGSARHWWGTHCQKSKLVVCVKVYQAAASRKECPYLLCRHGVPRGLYLSSLEFPILRLNCPQEGFLGQAKRWYI